MKRKLVSFDWALKNILRNKANFDILEGFLSELLKEEITILEILESESNQDYREQKWNRVDLKVKNQFGEIILIEIQYNREFDYLQRIFLATCRVATEHLEKGKPYSAIAKVISVNILYFDLGQGQDYVYHGKTQFTGIHHHDELTLSQRQRELFGKEHPYQLYPEYYLIKVNQFHDQTTDRLDQWIYFFKNEDVPDEFDAKGLHKAKEVLDILRLPNPERANYDAYAEDLRYQASMIESSYYDGFCSGIQEGRQEGEALGIQKGRQEGEAIGIQKGREEGEKAKALEIARQLLSLMDDATIAISTGLTYHEIAELRQSSTNPN